MKRLFLDDHRVPEDAGKYMPADMSHIYNEEWDIVRSYDEFTEYILKNGLPDIISFDHDLEDEHLTEPFVYSARWERTGYSCAKWLCDFCAHERLPLPEYYVHSMNPVGSDNIKIYLEYFKNNYNDREISESV